MQTVQTEPGWPVQTLWEKPGWEDQFKEDWVAWGEPRDTWTCNRLAPQWRLTLLRFLARLGAVRLGGWLSRRVRMEHWANGEHVATFVARDLVYDDDNEQPVSASELFRAVVKRYGTQEHSRTRPGRIVRAAVYWAALLCGKVGAVRPMLWLLRYPRHETFVGGRLTKTQRIWDHTPSEARATFFSRFPRARRHLPPDSRERDLA